jgi:uncharacterized membrane protein YjgN (DUF898 family)
VLLVPLPFLVAAYKAIEWRWWVGGIRFGAVRFESSLAKGALVGIFWKVVGWYVLLGVALGAWGGAVLFAALSLVDLPAGDERFAAVAQHPFLLLGTVVGYLLMAVAMGIVVRLYLNRDVWAKVAGTTTVHNLWVADDIVGQGDQVDALGEGLTDGLDIGGL